MKEYFVWLMKFITVIIVFFVVVPILILSVLMASSKTINTENIIPQEKNLVAVIDVNGIIMDSKDVVEKLYKAEELISHDLGMNEVEHTVHDYPAGNIDLSGIEALELCEYLFRIFLSSLRIAIHGSYYSHSIFVGESIPECFVK